MSKKTKILIVDDNENDLFLLDTLLRESGYEVVSAGNGTEALEKLRRDTVDIIISDIIMPGMDGFQLCRVCKKDDRLMRIPFVFYTATYYDKTDEEFALSLGSEKFMLKPLEPDAFLDTLKTIIEERKNVAPAALKIPVKDEEVYLAEYNKRLITQLEKKVLDLEKEVGERKQVERHLSVQYYVTQVLVESDTIKEASPKILQAVCMELEWDFGEIWVYNQHDCVLKCSESWHIPFIEIPGFKENTKNITFTKDIGLPGRVFSDAKPVWIEDVVHDSNFSRASVADKEGLHGAFGFPILSGSEVLGTICFYSHEIRKPDQDLLNMLTATGAQIGLFIKRKQAEEALRKANALLTNVINSTPDLIVVKDLELRTIMCNEAFASAVGKKSEELIGKTDIENGWDLELVHGCPEKGIHGFESDDLQVLRGRLVHNPSEPVNVGNEILIFDTKKMPLYDAKNGIIGILSIARDITDRRVTEKQIKASLKEKETLLMEIHHRVRNNLQIMSSLFLLHTRDLKDEKHIKVFKEAQNRIQSMSIIHEILYGSSHLSSIDFSQFVRTITEKLFSSYGIDSGKISLKMNIKDLSLEVDQAIPLGLIVNELLSNSLKHAFPFDKIRESPFEIVQAKTDGKQEKHEIRISLTVTPDNRIKLIVSDNGIGMPKDLDFRTTDSLGLNLVNIIAEGQLKGEISLGRCAKGTEFQILFGHK